MLKFIVVGFIFTTVSGAPLDDFRTQIGLVRPSPINPDIPMDPKPPERIILVDTKPDQPANVNYDNNQNADKLESDDTVKSNGKGQELIDSVTSGRPTTVYAIKADEKQRSDSFQTSHRIPNVDGAERNFETSHHIPAHIEDERTKLIENTKIAQKQIN